MKNCSQCNFEIETDDNFCAKCGCWTEKGYTFLKNNNEIAIKGKVVSQHNKMAYLFELMLFFMLLIIGVTIYRGKEILSPFVFFKRTIINYQYGYNTTILQTNNQYYSEVVADIESASRIINRDFEEQEWKCKNNAVIGKIEEEVESTTNILNVSFCDLDEARARAMATIINDVYSLFPGIKGYLTNISMSNDNNKNSYVASFQPIYQFVNSSNNIEEYNKVNKTQILLNSYYFLNDDKVKQGVKENWYVKDASWESLIAHEMGHYVSFVSLLKSKNIDNVMFVTKSNEIKINNIISTVNNQVYSKQLVNDALNNYNKKYTKNISVDEFSLLISKYANQKNQLNEYIYDEIIAESVHDYYLHGISASKASLEIVKILKNRLT